MRKKIKSALAVLLCLSLCSCCANDMAVNIITDANGLEIAVEPVETEKNNNDDPSDSSSDSGSNSSKPENGNPDSNGSQNNNSGGNNSNSGNGSVGGNYSESSNNYEGVAGTGSFNYGEALQKSFIFYELQRSGKLTGEERTNWRGDSGLTDGADNGVDLTGGLYDAGDNAKFNLPMAYTSTMLAWSVYEDKESYEKSGQLKYALSTIRYINDYLIKCHTAEKEYYYQVGDGHLDHAWWGASEVMQMKRPSYKVTVSSPGSTVVGEAAASLAVSYLVFKDVDKEYAEKCLKHAKQLFAFADETKSDSGYTAANGFYDSWSGFYDELSWAAGWLYSATGDKSYLTKAKDYFSQADSNYKWSLCWDDKGIGCALRLTQLTGEKVYSDFLEKSLDFWSATGSEKITVTPKGLSWLDQWGSLRYATTMAFVAASYSQCDLCPSAKRNIYWNWALSQVDYALGSTGRSFVCGFGENYPKNPHHRNAQGSYCDNMHIPEQARHTLYGALVGGPDSNDGYTDDVSNYNLNEVACDYNAGYTCALAKMYGRYGGKTIENFGAVEKVGTEYEVEACVNAAGDNFVEIKAIVYNKTAWPARVSKNLKLRYFINLSETSYSAASVKMGYSKDNSSCTIIPWDEENNIYCVEVDFGNALIYPGGQDACRSEVQFRMTSTVWDNSNDFSYKGLGNTQGSVQAVTSLALYDNGVLVCGTEPDGEAGEIPPTKPDDGDEPDNPPANTTPSETEPPVTAGSAEKGGITLSLAGGNSQPNAIGLNLEIINNSGKDINLGTLELMYFFTADGGSPIFECYYSAIEGASYQAVSGISGSFEKKSGENTDTALKISLGSGTLPAGAKLIINGTVHNSDWSNMNQNNDYSYQNAERIAVYSDGKLILGKEP